MENVIEVRLIEVRYAGVVVGRSTKVRDWGASGAFIGFAEPLPSGTSLVLRGDGVDQAARVVEVFESADPAVAGMQVTFVGAAAARPAPQPAAAALKSAPAAEAAPVPQPAPPTAAAPPSASPPSAAEDAPVEASEAVSSAVSGEPSAPATSEQGDGQGGSNGQGGGKRRRRRR